MSQFRPTDFDSDVKGALSDVVSNGVGLTFNPTAGVLSLDSADLTVFVDSDYIQSRQITLDSGQVVSLIDSDYIQSRQITLDSDEVVSLIDSDYIQSRQLTFATEQYVDSNITVAIDDLVGGAPGALDTLNELASALGDDSDFAGTVTNQLATKLDISNFDSSFDTRLATKTTDDVGEGSNLYYTTSRTDSDVLVLVDSNYVVSRVGAGTGVTVDTVGNEISIGQDVSTGASVEFAGITANFGGITVNGSLTVNDGVGRSVTTPRINVTQDGGSLVLNAGLDSTATPTNDVSILVNRGISNDVTIGWDESSDYWKVTNAAGVEYQILTRENEGSSPSAGGINADQLDSQEGSYYLDYNNFTNTPTSITAFGITDGTAGQVLQTDGNGNFTFETVAAGTPGDSATGYVGFEDYYYDVTGAGTTDFSTEAGVNGKVQVFRNGVLQDDSQFTFDPATGVVSLASPADSGDEVSIWGYRNTNLDGTNIDSDGNATFTGTVQIGNHNLNGSLVSTISSTTPTNINLYENDSYVGAKLIITVDDSATNHTQISESLILTVDSGDPLITTYGTLFSSDSALASFDAVKDATTTSLEVTMASANTSKVKVIYSLMDK